MCPRHSVKTQKKKVKRLDLSDVSNALGEDVEEEVKHLGLFNVFEALGESAEEKVWHLNLPDVSKAIGEGVEEGVVGHGHPAAVAAYLVDQGVVCARHLAVTIAVL